jgi:hypothetical protein
MEKEIEEIIAKNLPAQVGEVLKKTLEEGQANARLVVSQRDRLAENNQEITHLNKLLSEYKNLDEYQAKLDAREKQVSEKERNQKVLEVLQRAHGLFLVLLSGCGSESLLSYVSAVGPVISEPVVLVCAPPKHWALERKRREAADRQALVNKSILFINKVKSIFKRKRQ